LPGPALCELHHARDEGSNFIRQRRFQGPYGFDEVIEFGVRISRRMKQRGDALGFCEIVSNGGSRLIGVPENKRAERQQGKERAASDHNAIYGRRDHRGNLAKELFVPGG
jgi:hypothetical protein